MRITIKVLVSCLFMAASTVSGFSGEEVRDRWVLSVDGGGVRGGLPAAILSAIEHYAGKFPLWLAPVQAVVATITSEGEAYAQELYNRLKNLGIRAEIDTRNEKISYKVREHSLQKVPYLLVVGKREAEEKTVAVRTLGGEHQEVMGQEEIIARLLTESHKRV